MKDKKMKQIRQTNCRQSYKYTINESENKTLVGRRGGAKADWYTVRLMIVMLYN